MLHFVVLGVVCASVHACARAQQETWSWRRGLTALLANPMQRPVIQVRAFLAVLDVVCASMRACARTRQR